MITLELKNIPLFKRGKVRDVYDLGDKLLFVATDRISAFDVVMPNGIPQKGEILNLLSAFWFDFTRDIINNHMITVNFDEILAVEPRLREHRKGLENRSMLVKKTKPLSVECVVRGYISGSAWKDYKSTGKVCGITLPKTLEESGKLPEPIFTPSTKADVGHDMNISHDEMKKSVGEADYEFLKEKSIAIYEKASKYAESKGIIVADTKFEFGKLGNEIILIDELLTPDSSRFWPKSEYKSGRSQKSFDKQFVRDYLEILDWDKTPPGPELPEAIVEKTREKYLQAYKFLTGKGI